MRKLIAVGALVGGLLAVAGPAMAAQGGIGDPLTLAASGVLMPFFGAPGDASLLEVASPVGDNAALHMLFFDASCAHVGESVFMPLTTNDIAHLQVTGVGGVLSPPFFGSGALSGGLITIASATTGFSGQSNPLDNPIHSRMYVFNGPTGKSRIIEPIILDTYEFSGDPHTWSPLRTAVTFFAPRDLFNGISTQLYLICPKTTITNAGAFFAPAKGFPAVLPGLLTVSAPNNLQGIIFDTDENPLRDIETSCDCVRSTGTISVGISTTYGTQNTFTKLEANPASPGGIFPFTGYRSTSNGGPINDFFGRLSNGSAGSIDGIGPPGVPSNTR